MVLAAATARSDVSVCLHPPTDAAVTDPFRPPACPWCPGNRGLEYATMPGDEIRAVDAGRVSFVGQVAGVLYVTVDHDRTVPGPDAGLVVSTYGRLATAAVATDDRVTPGQVLGRAGGPTIVTLRRRGPDGPTYLDPAPLLGRASWRARLIPLDGSPARPPRPGPTACPVRSVGRVGEPVASG